MKTNITIDRAGRVVIPKAVRDALRLAPGDLLEIRTSNDEITLKPVRGEPAIRKKRGIWVYCGGSEASTEDLIELIDRVRDERIRDTLG